MGLEATPGFEPGFTDLQSASLREGKSGAFKLDQIKIGMNEIIAFKEEG